MEFISFYLIPGIVLGCIYALGAIGVSLTFGILRFANFAHGETMTLGVYISWSLVTVFGMHPLLAMVVAMVLTALIALQIDRWFYKPFRASPTVILVMASFGMMLMVRSVVQFGWGVQLKTLSPGIQLPMRLFDGALLINPKHLLILGATVVLMVAVHLMLTRTRIGKAMRATADSPELARVTGIDTEKVIRATWLMGSVLAVAAGVFLALDTHVETLMGSKLLLPMFAAAILGGIGRPFGAVAGGLVIGLAEELSSYPWIGTEPLLAPGYKAGIAFAIMVVMLIWRPQGIFKGSQF